MSNFGGAINSDAGIYDFDSLGSCFQSTDPCDGVANAWRQDVVAQIPFAASPFPGEIPQQPMFFGHRPLVLAGDFYRENEDVDRGVCITPSMLIEGSKFSGENASIRFNFSEMPPDAPSDPDFKLELNTFVPLHWGSATDIINRLLDFFEDEVVCTVTKVSRAKFAVKVDVFENGTMCSLKFRLYNQKDGQFAVEFQRRSGDSVSFHNVYQQASLKFEHGLACTETLVDATLLGDQQVFSTATELSPLVEMLQFERAPELQAEAVACLASIAGNDVVAAVAMCSENVFEHFKSLLDIDRIDVAYPTACLISLLSQCEEAKPLLSQFGLVSVMEEQIRAPQKCALVREQLMHGLSPV